MLRRHFSELPEGLVEKSEAGALGERGYGEVVSDEQLAANLRSARVAFQVGRCQRC